MPCFQLSRLYLAAPSSKRLASFSKARGGIAEGIPLPTEASLTAPVLNSERSPESGIFAGDKTLSYRKPLKYSRESVVMLVGVSIVS